MRRARRTDSVQPDIVVEFRAGDEFSVEVISDVGRGLPDLLVGGYGRSHLVECKGPKTPEKPDQAKFIVRWKGDYSVVKTRQDVLRLKAVWRLEYFQEIERETQS